MKFTFKLCEILKIGSKLPDTEKTKMFKNLHIIRTAPSHN